MRIPTLVQQIMPRVQRLGLIDPATGHYDPEEVAEYCLAALQYLGNKYQLMALLKMNREVLRTTAGIERYPWPGDYGPIYPEETDRSGVAIHNTDGTGITNLQWYDQTHFNLIRSTTTGRPVRYTMAENHIYLGPIPDAVYILESITRPIITADFDIPEQYVEMVTAELLFRLSSDLGRATPALLEERMQSTRAVVNGEARVRLRFQNGSYNRSLRGYGRRRWGR